MEDHVATKRDIDGIRRDLQELEHRLTATLLKWMFGALAAQTGVILAVVKYL